MRRVYSSISLLIHEEKGMAKILVAFSIIMLMGFTALVVDAGALYSEKSNLQKSLDAAVLGGAQVLNVSEADAKQVAIDLALKNGVTIEEGEVSTGSNFIEINKTVKKELTFAKVLGFDKADVGATARAERLQTLLSGEGIIPVAIEKGGYDAGQPYTMHFQPGNKENESISGNFGFLAIDGPGGKDLETGIKNGSTREVNEEFEYTKTGLSWGNVKAGFGHRITEDEGKEHCQSFETADKTCSRVVTVPIVKTFEGANGKDMVKIVGFAAFWIDYMDEKGKDKKVVGRFIDDFTREGIFGEGENFGISGVKLVK